MSLWYYQEIAINRAVEAVAKEKAILISMATGTGKTFVASQVIWKLWKTGRIKKVRALLSENSNTGVAGSCIFIGL